MEHRKRSRRAFTLIELVAVIVVLAILAGVALPKYFDYAAQARESACKGALGGIRAGIANFYANSAIQGTPQYPTLAELIDPGDVMQDILPENPYNGANTVEAATAADAATRVVTTPSPETGWRFYVDNSVNPPVYTFWPNSNVAGENDF